MKNVRGIIFAYHNYPELGDLGKYRTASALPFSARYRLIDFALSGMMNAGIYNVDVLMQFGYQSLLDHFSGGRPWNMVRHNGGLHPMLAKVNAGVYGGDMEALATIYTHLRDYIKEEYIVMTRGDLCANVDVKRLLDEHVASGADMTALCTDRPLPGEHHCFIPDGDGFAKDLLCRRNEATEGVRSLETYVVSRENLLKMVKWCAEGDRLHFHRDAMLHMMRDEGWRIKLQMHEGYARTVTSIQEYFDASKEMLDTQRIRDLFKDEREIATRARSDVSTYYSDTCKVRDSLVADGCVIEGDIDHCLISSGVRIAPGAKLRNCVVMNNTTIESGADLTNVILDKDVTVKTGVKLVASEKLPLVVPRNGVIAE
ncbi:MAG: glucose-1-phosphate adenylyltransferase subunit GlgD [Oscillospiraceae bacterium]|nr:glucose-1-phosphate adenylyltransferase subunit GlgD [Oscillospiraceae bacterium]